MTDLMRISDLEVHFPIRSGVVDAVRRRPRIVVRAVDGIDLTLAKGEVSHFIDSIDILAV